MAASLASSPPPPSPLMSPFASSGEWAAFASTGSLPPPLLLLLLAAAALAAALLRWRSPCACACRLLIEEREGGFFFGFGFDRGFGVALGAFGAAAAAAFCRLAPGAGEARDDDGPAAAAAGRLVPRPLGGGDPTSAPHASRSAGDVTATDWSTRLRPMAIVRTPRLLSRESMCAKSPSPLMRTTAHGCDLAARATAHTRRSTIIFLSTASFLSLVGQSTRLTPSRSHVPTVRPRKCALLRSQYNLASVMRPNVRTRDSSVSN